MFLLVLIINDVSVRFLSWGGRWFWRLDGWCGSSRRRYDYTERLQLGFGGREAHSTQPWGTILIINAVLFVISVHACFAIHLQIIFTSQEIATANEKRKEELEAKAKQNSEISTTNASFAISSSKSSSTLNDARPLGRASLSTPSINRRLEERQAVIQGTSEIAANKIPELLAVDKSADLSQALEIDNDNMSEGRGGESDAVEDDDDDDDAWIKDVEQEL